MTFTAGQRLRATDLQTLETNLTTAQTDITSLQALAPLGWLMLQQSTASISNSTDTAISWSSVHTSKGVTVGDYWTSGNATRIYTPVTGIYQFQCNVAWASNTTGLRVAYLYKNGTTKIWQQNHPVDATSPCHGQNFQYRGPFTAADYFELKVWQSSGGSLSAAYYPLYMTVIRIS